MRLIALRSICDIPAQYDIHMSYVCTAGYGCMCKMYWYYEFPVNPQRKLDPPRKGRESKYRFRISR